MHCADKSSPSTAVFMKLKQQTSFFDFINLHPWKHLVSGDHKLIAVEDLADLAKSKLEPFKQEAEDKFEELSSLVKETTIQISQWDVDTEANVRIIHQARDQQVSSTRTQLINSSWV